MSDAGCDPIERLEGLMRGVESFIEYIDSCDEEKGGDGYIDTGNVLDYVQNMRECVANINGE